MRLGPVLLLAVCASAPALTAPPRPARVPTVRYAAGRADVPYDETFAQAKRKLLRRINRERLAAGVNPLDYSLRAARAGDSFCFESAALGLLGHWDVSGRSPYLRWAEAGGVDPQAENFASESRMPGPIITPPDQLLLEAHARMMAEVPPDDGHRRTVLDPKWTHVGIGMALRGGEFRMTEEYVREVADWVEVPAAPLSPGADAPFSAKLPPGWNTGLVEVCYEPLPRPMTPAQIAGRRRYGLPPPAQRYVAAPPDGSRWEGGEKGNFAVAPDGTFRLVIPLDKGRGDYYVLVFAVKGAFSGQAMTPSVQARIRAE